MKTLTCIFITFAMLLVAGTARAGAQTTRELTLTAEHKALLAEIDSLLGATPALEQAKLERLTTKREAYTRAEGAERRYWLAADLYDEYSTFDSDSALLYADRAMSLAREMGRPDLADEMRLNRAYVYAATGLLEDAKAQLDAVDVHGLSTGMLWKYYDTVLFLDSRRTQYIGGERSDGNAYAAAIDSLLQATVATIRPDDPNYSWFVGWAHFKDAGTALDVIPEIAASVDRRRFDSRRDAMDAWVLSKLYEYAGDPSNKLKYLLLSAIADLRSVNKEIASIEEVAEILFNEGDLERSNAYITHSIACANAYKSRVRLGHLASIQERTMNAIHERLVRQERQNRLYLAALAVILVALLVVILVMLKRSRQLRRSRSEVEQINGELHARIEETQATREQLRLANQQLHDANTRLREANDKLSDMYEQARSSAAELARLNESREQYIANVFALCSDYVDKLDGFRKNILRMITARRFDEIHALTKNPELSQAEVKELYENFDRVFLNIYPDFVADFNTLLRPEERIELRQPGRLTTELRIYAMVRLGINDSVRIAKFLHCSVQTVYNVRQRTRNKAVIPKDVFAATVSRLGKPAF